MKAAFIEQVGSPANILIGELPIPVISKNQVLVKVHYTIVNHVDCYIRSGKYAQALPKPFILGRDFCGEVVQVGKEINTFKVGDKVWSNCQGIHGRQGSFAEYLAVSENTLFHLPDKVDPLEAIAVFHSALTAIIGLEREARLRKQEVLYVNGAAGSIGAAVIQVAKAQGAMIIASTHGQEKTAYCQQLGADAVIDYKQDIGSLLSQLAPNGVNVFWNTSRLHDFKLSLPLLALKGRYILMAGAGTEAMLPVGELYTRDTSILGFTITNASLDEISKVAVKINALLEQGLIKVKIDSVLPLEETRQAHTMMESSSLWGKIVIKVS